MKACELLFEQKCFPATKDFFIFAFTKNSGTKVQVVCVLFSAQTNLLEIVYVSSF